MNLSLWSSNFCLFVCCLLFVSPECPPEMQAAMFCLFWPSSGGGRRGFTLLLIARIILEKLTRQSGQKDGREEQGRTGWRLRESHRRDLEDFGRQQNNIIAGFV